MINKLAYNQIEKSFGPEIFYTHSLQYLELIYGEKSESLGLQNNFFKFFNPLTRLGSKAKFKLFQIVALGQRCKIPFRFFLRSEIEPLESLCRKNKKNLWSRFWKILSQNQHFFGQICLKTHFDGHFRGKEASKSVENFFLLKYTSLCINSIWIEVF